jgi:molybdopterin molybdotransferase
VQNIQNPAEETTLLPYETALDIVSRTFLRLHPDNEIIPVQSALHRTLAEDVYTDIAQPSFDNSSMDGIAIRYASGVTEWELIGEAAAGDAHSITTGGHTAAVLIMTGARMPQFADTVIPVEKIRQEGDKFRLADGYIVKQGSNVRFAGSDCTAGTKVLERGTVLVPRHFHVLAAAGRSTIAVLKPLKMAFLSTGNELISPTQSPTGSQVRLTSNSFLSAAILQSKQIPVPLGVVQDDYDALLTAVSSALASDISVLMTTGGVSAGKYDLLPSVFQQCGVTPLFHKVNIKPGKPLHFGSYQQGKRTIVVIGFPGNPVSTSVNYELFVNPALRALYQQEAICSLYAVLTHPLVEKDSRRSFSRGSLRQDGNRFTVTPFPSLRSSNMFELAQANCLIEVPETIESLPAGSEVRCIRI